MKFKHIVYNFFIICFLAIVNLTITSCKKDKFFSKGNLAFSKDTVVFDTVFTTIGSTTQQFKFYNKDSKKLLIDEIELMGGSNSPFRINIDGINGISHKNIEMLPKDSLFGFVEVTLKVNNQLLPMIIEDSIRFRTNGKDQYLKLAVWGQDAYFHYKDLNDDINNPWNNDKPHVIYGAAFIDSAKTLTIPQDTKVYLHKNSMLVNYKGTLIINGTKGHEVRFMGDRLEQDYKTVAGQYYGIYMQEAKPSTINYLIQENGSSGIHLTGNNVSNSPSDYTLTITNSILTNNANYGFFLYDGSKLKAENCVISRNGAHSLFVLRGASFDFTHCDLVGYGSSKTASVGIRNYYDGIASNIPFGKFKNSVIYGSQEYEIVFDTVNPNSTAGLINLQFANCVVKYKDGTTNSLFQNNNTYLNEDPKFTDPSKNNFKPMSGSSLSDRGSSLYALPFDIEGNSRNMSSPDIGAYEF